MVHTIRLSDTLTSAMENTIRPMQEEIQPERKGNVTYGIDDLPPWYLCIFMALQHYLTMIGAIVAIPFILCPALCMSETDPDMIIILRIFMYNVDLETVV